MTPCPAHPFTPLTALGCGQCHGEELAGIDSAKKPFVLKRRGRGRPRKQNFDAVPEEDEGRDPEVQDEVLRTIKGWKGRNKDEWGRWQQS